jgi:hypothetical protein
LSGTAGAAEAAVSTFGESAVRTVGAAVVTCAADAAGAAVTAVSAGAAVLAGTLQCWLQ